MRPGVRARLLLAVVVGALPALVGAGTPPADEDAGLPRSYLGHSFGQEVNSSPTQRGQQSKLWFHAGSWWSLLLDNGGENVRVHRLEPDHTWQATGPTLSGAAGDTGDALPDGDTLSVIVHAREGLRHVPLVYDRTTGEYREDGEATIVADRDSSEPAALARDSAGRTWMTYATATEVLVSYSDDRGRTWRPPFRIAALGGERREVSAIVAFDDRIGVMWSDELSGAFLFAQHTAGAPGGEWSAPETALPGPARSHDHVNLSVVRDPAGPDIVAAAVQEEAHDGTPDDAPLVTVLLRTADGQWSDHVAGTVADRLNAPVLRIDVANRALVLVADAGGSIFTKTVTLDGPSFSPGRGVPVLLSAGSRLQDPAGSSQAVDPRTGLVILANGSLDRAYHHAEVPLGGPRPSDPGDSLPPSPPARLDAVLNGAGAVILRWPAARDGSDWAPASPGSTAASYAVFRDGDLIATTEQTAYVDLPRSGGAHTYAVEARDWEGNASPPATLDVDVPPPGAAPARALVAATLLLGAVALIALMARRRRRALPGPLPAAMAAEHPDRATPVPLEQRTPLPPERGSPTRLETQMTEYPEVHGASGYRASHAHTDSSRYDEQFNDPTRAKGMLWLIEQEILGAALDEFVPRPGRALDFACGTGRLTAWLCERAAEVTGVDVSDSMLAGAAMNAPGAILVKGDVLEEPDLIEGEFDLVTLFRFLLNAEPEVREGVVRWLAKSMPGGSHLVVNVHRNSSSLTGLQARLRRAQRRSRTPRTLSVRSAVRLIEDHGFTVVAQYGYGFLPYGAHGAARVRGAAVVRRIERLLAGRGRRAQLASHVIVVARRTP